MICFFCGGPAHPANGHAYSETAMSCERCYREFMKFYKGRLRNPIGEAAVVEPGKIIEGEWTQADEACLHAKREKRKKDKARR